MTRTDCDALSLKCMDHCIYRCTLKVIKITLDESCLFHLPVGKCNLYLCILASIFKLQFWETNQ